MFWRPLNGCPSFFHISSWSAAHLLQPFHSHLSTNDDQHHATPWLATCRDSAAGCHASRPPCKLSDPFLSRIGRHFPTTLASLGRLESWLFFALTFKGVLAFGKMWMWEETGVGWDGQIGTTAKTKKKQFLPTGKAWIAGRGIITITFIIIIIIVFLPPIVLWHKPKHQSTGTPFSCCFFPRWKVETNLSHVETKKQLESHDTNNGNIPPIQNSSRFVATAVSWNEQGCCLCPLSVAVAVAVTMICLLKTLGITAQRRGKPIPLQFVAP